MNTSAKIFQHKTYIVRPVYVNRNRNNTNKDVNKHLGDYEITNGDYYVVGFITIALTLTLTRLIYKLFKNEKKNKHPSWLVPEMLAKKLKKIGFNKKCYFTVLPIGVCGAATFDADHLGLQDTNFEVSSMYGGYDLPFWEQVLEWFRERGFYSYIKKKSFPERYIYYIEYGLTTYSKENLRDELLPKTYEEAREEMIRKLIELYNKANNIENEE